MHTTASVLFRLSIRQSNQQKNGLGYKAAHSEAVRIEGLVTGSVRGDHDSDLDKNKSNGKVDVNWSREVKITKDGIETKQVLVMIQRIIVKNGNVISVKTIEKRNEFRQH